MGVMNEDKAIDPVSQKIRYKYERHNTSISYIERDVWSTARVSARKESRPLTGALLNCFRKKSFLVN